jgi:hypothetical protein
MKKSFNLFLMIFALAGNSIVPAHAEVKDFPCTGGTYSVEIPAAELKSNNGCTGNLIIDSSIKSIGKSAFKYSALTSVVIPNSVTTIGDQSFYSSGKLTSVVIPNSVTSIGNNAFSWSALTSVVIPSSVTRIGDLAFFNNQLTSIIIPNSITVIKIFSFADNNLSSVTIPNSVIEIESFAFRDNPNLTTVDIADTVEKIGSDAFGDKIKSIVYCGPAVANLPTSPTCPPERKAIFDAAVVAKAAAEEAAAEKAFSELKTFPCGSGGTYSVRPYTSFFGDGIEIVGHRNCSGSVVIDRSVTKIRSSAFEGSLITDIFIPDTVKYIDSWAFKDTSQLKKVRFPDYLDEIPLGIFKGSSIEEIQIPESTRKVAFYAFNGSMIKKFDYCGSETIYDGQYKKVIPFCQEKIDAAAAAWEADYQRQQEADKITITCKKGSSTKKIFGLSPKCPKGYVKVVPIARCTKSEISTFENVNSAMAGLMFSFNDARIVFSSIDKAKKATKNKSLLALYLKLESAVEAGGKGRSGKSKEAWYALKSKFEYNRC